ncbi:MAG TPA: hypothetical protein ENG70_00425 [Candidatus Cloacimonetes bacterium]|nr:hypothetical protein [Candidatus Cloacimonadota bacterium]HEX37320.1 hypothetical protein [Candidatus Cloacimonadota bacterium]
MKKIVILAFLLLLSSSAFAVYQVGDVVDNFSWTDSNGETHSIYDLIDAQKAIVFFWGGTG